MHRLTFTITPNPNGYVAGCNELPSLFIDVQSMMEIDKILRNLLCQYMHEFPDDAQKRGLDKDMPIQIIWQGSPNSIGLE